MEIAQGFQIKEPFVFIPWRISEEELKNLLSKNNLKRVSNGYYTVQCKSLGGISHKLGFHFSPLTNGKLTQLEFFNHSASNINESYVQFQTQLELYFGKPTLSKQGAEGFESHVWNLEHIYIEHLVQYRWSVEESLFIKLRH